jgi:hydroxymethylbilane synthase
MDGSLKVGTRGSPLALAQAYEVRDRLQLKHEGLEVEIVVIRTTGDKVQDRVLAEIGGKGLFTKEIEEGLFDGSIDIAVHSMKDVETALPDGLAITTVLPREDPRDAFICNKARNLMELPAGSVVGTASLRRQAQLRMLRPDLEVQPMRGSVNTRLRKLNEGEADATFLAYAGLLRLNMADSATCLMQPEEMLPAVAQGAIGVEGREDDTETRDLLASIHDRNTAYQVDAERALLAALDGSCRTPIGGLAELTIDGGLSLRGLVASPDGRKSHAVLREGCVSDAKALGRDAGEELRALAGAEFLN